MTKKLVCILLVAMLAGTIPHSAAGQNREDQSVQRVKEGVAKIGTGEKSRVKVELKVGTRIEGYINQIDDQSFSVVDRKTGQSTSIAYTDVAKLKGKGMSTAVKIVIVASVGLAAILIWLTAAGFWSD